MRYKQVKDGEWIQPTMTGHRMACCDCGLVHTFDFRIVKQQVQLRAVRHPRATAARRRNLKRAKS